MQYVNEHYDESLDVRDSEEVASLYNTPSPRTQLAPPGPGGGSQVELARRSPGPLLAPLRRTGLPAARRTACMCVDVWLHVARHWHALYVFIYGCDHHMGIGLW